MLFLLSPAKALDYDTPLPADVPHTQPQFVGQSKELIKVLADQNARLVERVEAHRVRLLWLTGFMVAIVIAVLAIALFR